MSYTMEKLAGSKVKFSFEESAEAFESALQKAYLKERGRIAVPGFRKGKAPRVLIERMYGDKIFFDDAFEALFEEAYIHAVAESGVRVVSQPSVDVQTLEAGQPAVFSCEVWEYPAVTLGQYKGVEVTRRVAIVPESEIDQKIEEDRRRVARTLEITDSPAAEGDVANIDYAGSVDGVAFEGGTAQGHPLKLGSGSFIPGFEEQVIGMSVGEEGDVTVTFPTEYHEKSLAGKEAVFHVKVNGITREELPALDDDFAVDVSDFETFAEYRDSIAAKLADEHEKRADGEAKDAMIQKVIDGATFDLPDPMVEDKLDEMMDRMGRRMQQQGFSMEQFLQMTGNTMAKFRDAYRDEAKRNLSVELVMEAVLEAEKDALAPTDEEIQHEYADYAENFGMEVEKFVSSLNDDQKATIRQNLGMRKAADLLWDSAVVTTEMVDPTEPAVEAAEEAAEAVEEAAEEAAEAADAPEA